MQFLLNAVICASMAADAQCHPVNPQAGVTYATLEQCQDMARTYNIEQIQRRAEKPDGAGQSAKVWTYYCRAVSG